MKECPEKDIQAIAVIQPLNDYDFYSRLAETQGPSLVSFTKAGCGSCRTWHNLLEQIQLKRKEITIFEVDAEENMALAREYELFHLPAIFLFVNGHYHCAVESEARLAAFDSALMEALGSPTEEAP